LPGALRLVWARRRVHGKTLLDNPGRWC